MKLLKYNSILPITICVVLIISGVLINSKGSDDGNGYLLGGGIPLAGFTLQSLFKILRERYRQRV
jgi:hypothetical protein